MTEQVLEGLDAPRKADEQPKVSPREKKKSGVIGQQIRDKKANTEIMKKQRKGPTRVREKRDPASTSSVTISSFRKKVAVKKYLVFIMMAIVLVLTAVPLVTDFVLVKSLISSTDEYQESLYASNILSVFVMLQQGLFYSEIKKTLELTQVSALQSKASALL